VAVGEGTVVDTELDGCGVGIRGGGNVGHRNGEAEERPEHDRLSLQNHASLGGLPQSTVYENEGSERYLRRL
jgi:hypothetical protein